MLNKGIHLIFVFKLLETFTKLSLLDLVIIWCDSYGRRLRNFFIGPRILSNTCG